MKKSSSLDNCWPSARRADAFCEETPLDLQQPLLLKPCSPPKGLATLGSHSSQTSLGEHGEEAPLVTKVLDLDVLSKAEPDCKGFVGMGNCWEPICWDEDTGSHGDDVTMDKDDDSGNNSMSGAGSTDKDSMSGRARSSSSGSKMEPDIELSEMLQHGDRISLDRDGEFQTVSGDCCETNLADFDEGVVDFEHESELNDGCKSYFPCGEISPRMNSIARDDIKNVPNGPRADGMDTPELFSSDQIIRNSSPYDYRFQPSSDYPAQITDSHYNESLPHPYNSSHPHTSAAACHPSKNSSKDPGQFVGAQNFSGHSTNLPTFYRNQLLPSASTQPHYNDNLFTVPLHADHIHHQPQNLSSSHYYGDQVITVAPMSVPSPFPHVYLSGSRNTHRPMPFRPLPMPYTLPHVLTDAESRGSNSSSPIIYNHPNFPHPHFVYDNRYVPGAVPIAQRIEDQIPATHKTALSSEVPSSHARDLRPDTSSSYSPPQQTELNNSNSTDTAKDSERENQQFYPNHVPHPYSPQHAYYSTSYPPPASYQPRMPGNASFWNCPDELRAKLQEMNVKGHSRFPTPDQVVMVPVRRDQQQQQQHQHQQQQQQPDTSHGYLPGITHYPQVSKQLNSNHNNTTLTGLDTKGQTDNQIYHIYSSTLQNSHHINQNMNDYPTFSNPHQGPIPHLNNNTSQDFHGYNNPSFNHPHQQVPPIPRRDLTSPCSNETAAPSFYHQPTTNLEPSLLSRVSRNYVQTSQQPLTPVPVTQSLPSSDNSTVLQSSSQFPLHTGSLISNDQDDLREEDKAVLPSDGMGEPEGEIRKIPNKGRGYQRDCSNGSCPDYTPLCIVACLFNPFFGIFALLANRYAKRNYRHRKSNYANNLYFFAILSSSIAIFSTIMGVLMLTAIHLPTKQSAPPIVMNTPTEDNSCHGRLFGYDKTMQNFYNMSFDLYCQVVDNHMMVEALNYFIALRNDIYGLNRKPPIKVKSKESEIPKNPDERTKAKTGYGATSSPVKFAPPVENLASNSESSEVRDRFIKEGFDKCYREWMQKGQVQTGDVKYVYNTSSSTLSPPSHQSASDPWNLLAQDTENSSEFTKNSGEITDGGVGDDTGGSRISTRDVTTWTFDSPDNSTSLQENGSNRTEKVT